MEGSVVKAHVDVEKNHLAARKMCSLLLCAASLEEPIKVFVNRHSTNSAPLNKMSGVCLGSRYADIHLTLREAHTSLFLMLGYTSKEIARELGLSPRTVEFYLSCIKSKLNLTRKSAIIRTLLQSEFITNFEASLKNNSETTIQQFI